MDLLSGGLDQLLDFGGGGGAAAPVAAAPPVPTGMNQLNQNPMGGGLLDILGGPTPTLPVDPAPTSGLDALGSMGLFDTSTNMAPSNKV